MRKPIAIRIKICYTICERTIAERRIGMRSRITAAVLAVWVMMAAGCGSISRTDPEYVVTGMADPVPVETIPAETETETASVQNSTASFLAVGDDLIHSRVYMTAAEHAEEGEEYNFGYCYQYVADEVAAADIAFVNQETVICGDDYEITGSNLNFNSPTELGDALIDTGFDIICMANNHVLDKGESGMSACLDYWDSQVAKHPDLTVLGAYRDYQDMYDYRIREVNGIKVGILAYTEHTNGYSLPGDSEMEIPYTTDTELMQKQITELKEQVDCVVVSAHWGVEDTHVVTDAVKALAQDLIDWGADVVIGTGPHTLQTMEYLTRPDGTQGFVYYSLGNFISGQTDNFNMVGGMAKFDITMTDGTVTIENPTCTPIITQYETGGLKDVRVIPYYLYTDELVENHGVPYSPVGTQKSWSWDIINTIIEENVPEEYRRLEK